MTRHSRIFAAVLLPFVALLLALLLYLGVAFAMLLLPTDTPQRPGKASINAFVISNGVHVDLVFPVKSPAFDWTGLFPLRDFTAPPAKPVWIALGWGDREFYLNTQELRDLTPGRAIGALAGGHRTLVHVNYLPDLNFSTHRYSLPLSAMQYATLIAYVRASLALSPSGSAVAIADRHYGPLDAFYEARGSYNLFNTCNTWVGDGLRRAGVPISRWTPLDTLVTWRLQPAPEP